MPTRVAPSKTSTDPTSSSAIFLMAEYTFSPGPTETQPYPFALRRCLIVVIGASPLNESLNPCDNCGHPSPQLRWQRVDRLDDFSNGAPRHTAPASDRLSALE